MVIVRPTIKVLKALNVSDKLPPHTEEAYRCAARANEPSVRGEYLREAVAHAQEELALVTYIQKRFDQGIFERHRSFADPVFESRDTARPAWRGAVVHDGGDYAWLIYAAIHDHFHSEVKAVLKGMKQSGGLGPTPLDLEILQKQEAEDERLALNKASLLQVLGSIKDCVASGKRAVLKPGGLDIEIDVDTIPFEDWEVASAHHEMDMVSVRIRNWQEHYARTNDLVAGLTGVLNVPPEMVESLAASSFKLQLVVSRATLISVLDLPATALEPEHSTPPPPSFLHYSRKQDLNEAFFTGKAVQAVCGKWWVPIGDDLTHHDLPVCPECEREMPVAQALRHFANQRQG